MMLGMSFALLPENTLSHKVDSTDERVVTLIGIAGSYHGTGMIGVSPALACRLSSAMLMAEYTAVDSEVLDAMGEVSNIIFGNVKTLLEEQVGPLGLSIPTAIHGKNFSIRTPVEQWVVLPLEVEGALFDLRLCLSQNSQSGKSSIVQQIVSDPV